MNMAIAQAQVLSKNKLLFIVGLSWLFDAMDVGLLSFILAALKQDWNLTAIQLGWIGSINSIGMAAGAFLFGIYADKKGRKSALIITLLLFSLACGLSAFAWGLGSLMVLRFLIGMGLGGELPVASTLVSESVPPHERGRTIVLLESFWAFGWIAAAMMAYFLIPLPEVGWRGVMLLCALPAFYALYLRIHLPDTDSFRNIRQSDREQTIREKIQLLFSADCYQQTLVLWVLWFCVVFSYYGMFLWLPSVMVLKGFTLVKGFGYVLAMSLAQLPGYFSAAWLIERVGRKAVLTGYLLGTVLSGYCFAAADDVTQLLLWGALLSFFNLGAWGALYAYTPEHYPARVRATGAGFAAAIGRIGGILGPLLVGYLMVLEFSISAIFSLFCLALLIAIVTVMLWGKETKMSVLD